VWWTFSTSWHYEHPPAHAQVHHQHATSVEIAQQILAMTASFHHARPGEAIDDRFATLPPHRSFAKDFNSFDGATNESPLEAATNGFDFGQLRHNWA
jgi:hypothetical protein